MYIDVDPQYFKLFEVCIMVTYHSMVLCIIEPSVAKVLEEWFRYTYGLDIDSCPVIFDDGVLFYSNRVFFYEF